MKTILSLAISLFCLNATAFVTSINQYDKNSALSEKEALNLVYNTFLYELWQEGNGISCGGDFKSLEMTNSSDNKIVVSGIATQGQDNCAVTSEVRIEVEIEKTALGAVVNRSSISHL